MVTMDRFMFEKVLAYRKKQVLQDLPLYLITDRSRFPNTTDGETRFLDHIAACLEGGVRIVQLRESHNVPTRRVLALARSLRSITWEMEALLIISERTDIAKAVDADGVHLGPEDMDIPSARKIVGSEFIIGASAHTQTEAQVAFDQEIDYLTAGPVFASEMVPGQPAVGVKFLEWMSKRTDIPWFAAGGIDASAIPKVIETGATRVALTRALMAAKHPEAEAKKLLQQFSKTPALSVM